ncbi:MAG: WD40 repeat domain-containing serine/threonine protein kinase [Bryobacterales bacterium]
MTIEAGNVVGDYQVLGSLGAGGVGRVYKVRHSITGRIEALKILLPDYAQNEQQAERFLREIKVQANLHHPNIASVHNAFRVGGSLLMVMEFVDGESLDKLIARGRLPLQQALDYASQALSALSYAHGRGVVHRDVKPENMLVTPGGALKVTDFGLAKTVTDIRLTVTGATLGSLYYISPEQVSGGADLDKRADIYSMGAVLYELVTGRRPFEGSQPFHLMQAHVEQPPRPPVELVPSLPPPLNDAILRALQKRPEARFDSAETFQSAVDAALPRTSVSAAQPIAGVGGTGAGGSHSSGDVRRPSRAPEYQTGAKVDSRRAIPARPPVKRLLIGLSFLALIVSLAAFTVWRTQRPDPAKTVAVPSGSHRLLRKVIPAGHVQAIVFNAADDLAAVLTSKGIVEVWEPESGKKRATFSAADRRSKAIALSPDGSAIVFAGNDSRLSVWDVATGEEQLRLDAGRGVRSVAMSGDGALLAVGSDQFLTVWELDSSRRKDPVHRLEYSAQLVSFRPDGRTVAVAGQDTLTVQPLHPSGAPARLSMSDGGPTTLAFAPEKDMLAAVGGNRLTIWRGKTLEEIQKVTLPGRALALGFTGSGHCVALTASGQMAQIWNAAEETEVSGFLHAYDVEAAALSIDGRLAATATAAGDLWFWKADAAWDRPENPMADPANSQRSNQQKGKPRKGVFRRFVDVFRGRR